MAKTAIDTVTLVLAVWFKKKKMLGAWRHLEPGKILTYYFCFDTGIPTVEKSNSYRSSINCSVYHVFICHGGHPNINQSPNSQSSLLPPPPLHTLSAETLLFNPIPATHPSYKAKCNNNLWTAHTLAPGRCSLFIIMCS